MKRREFIGTSSALALTATFGGIPVHAGNPYQSLGTNALNGDSILIVVQMFGGNDALNTIVPVEDQKYYDFRPNIALPKKTCRQYANSNIWLHSSLVEGINTNVIKNGMMGLLDTGRLAIVQGIGYENPNLSHFRSTDIWLSGFNNSDPNFRLNDGWIGRFFASKLPNFPIEIPEHPLAIQIGGSLSLLLQSQKGDMGIALTDPDSFFQLGQGLSPDEQFMSETDDFAREFNYIRAIAEQSDKYSQVVKDAFSKGTNTLTYANGFAQQLRLVARLISGGLRSRVFMVYLGGFDTHVQQQTAIVDRANAPSTITGVHPSLLNQLATGITQFMTDMIEQGFENKIVGLTVSEFGRRPRENGSNGTDHGAGSVQFVFGGNGAVNGGIYGKAFDLSSLDANSDLTYQYDYRRVYSDVLRNWFGGSQEETDAILAERFLPLNVLKTVTSVGTIFEDYSEELQVYPNPAVGGNVNIKFTLKTSSPLAANIYDASGKRISTIQLGLIEKGESIINLKIPNLSGMYFIELTNALNRKLCSVVVP